jgi:hypothetical protein
MAAVAEASCPRAAAGVLALRLLRLAPVRLLTIDVVVWSDSDGELATGAGAAPGHVDTSHCFYYPN